MITVVSIATGRADDKPLVLSVINTLYHFPYDMSINIVSQSNGTNLQIVNKYFEEQPIYSFSFYFKWFRKPLFKSSVLIKSWSGPTVTNIFELLVVDLYLKTL